MIDTPHPSDAELPSFLGGEYGAVVEGLQLEASVVLQGHLSADNNGICYKQSLIALSLLL